MHANVKDLGGLELLIPLLLCCVLPLILRPSRVRATPRQVDHVIHRELEVSRDIVKIRCRYCGKLYTERGDYCPHCGTHN